MLPAFVIHDASHTERDDIVKDIVAKTDATQFQAYVLSDGLRGNLFSHIGVAKLAKSLFPDQHYLVFEDDCELLENWKDTIADVSGYDVMYLGYNDRCKYATFGTHALCISPKARDLIIEKAGLVAKQVDRKNAFDHILSAICRDEHLLVCMPKIELKETFCRQKKGLRSTITGEIRV